MFKKLPILLSFSLIGLACQSQSQLFFKYPGWNRVLQRSEESNKQILLYFGASWCAPCVQLRKGVFSDTSTKSFLLSRFQCYDFDIDDSAVTELIKKYRIVSVPVIAVVNSKGYLKKLVLSIPQGVTEFKDRIKEIADSGSFYPGISNRIDMPFPAFYNKYFESRWKVMPDSAIVDDYLKTQADPLSEVNWDVMTVFNQNVKYFDLVVSNRGRLTSQYGEEVSFKIRDMSMLLTNKYINEKDSIRFDSLNEKLLTKRNDTVSRAAWSAFYMREIRFFAFTGLDWNKFVERTKAYVDRFGEADNHFICNYVYHAGQDEPDSIDNLMLRLMAPVLTKMPYSDTYIMYGGFLLKTGNDAEAERWFRKALDGVKDSASYAKYEKEIKSARQEYRKELRN
jgi:thioredoxin-related protein